MKPHTALSAIPPGGKSPIISNRSCWYGILKRIVTLKTGVVRDLNLSQTTKPLIVLLAVGFGVQHVDADMVVNFGTPTNQFSIDFVTIGNAGNAADTTGAPNPAGGVNYEYAISKYAISERLVNTVNTLSSSGLDDGLGISIDTRGANKPATSVSWHEAARFVNWLNTNQGYSPAYKFVEDTFQLWDQNDAGFDSDNHFRNSLAQYFLPSADEFYKAAFYDPALGQYFDHATGSNVAPTAVTHGTISKSAVYGQPLSSGPADVDLAGGLSPYGTMGQSGNVTEWEESALDGMNSFAGELRGMRGGHWQNTANVLTNSSRFSAVPHLEFDKVGFRVASKAVAVPEPSGFMLLGLCAVMLSGRLWLARRRK